MKSVRRESFWLLRTIALGLMVMPCAGCELFHNLGTGVHYDAPDDKPLTDKSKRVRDIVVEVTTDAGGAVTQVHIKHSSGETFIDQYIADSARNNWAGRPSTLTVIEITYSGEKGFSNPKVLSVSPAT